MKNLSERNGWQDGLMKHQWEYVRQLRISLAVCKRPATSPVGHGARLRSVRRQLLEGEPWPECDLCGGRENYLFERHLKLHHLHYKTWGHEEAEDMTLLCPRCYALVHQGDGQELCELLDLTNMDADGI